MSSVGTLRILSQIIILPILSRYLNPSDYGLMALCMPFLLFVMSFSDAGMSGSFIRSQQVNQKEWSTGFWLFSSLGLILSLVLTFIGQILSVLMNQEVLFPLIATLSLVIILQSIATIPGAAIQQNGRFPLLASIEIISTLVSLFSAVIAAVNGWGVWTLILQQISHFTTKLLFTILLSPFKPSFYFELNLLKNHFSFGRDMMANNIVGFLKTAVTNVIIGKFTGSHSLGIYTMATTFSDLFNKVISGPVQLVMYRRFSELNDNLDNFRNLFLLITRIISIIIIPMMGMIAAAHGPVFIIFLSDKWSEAGYIFALLSLGAAIQTSTALRNTIAMSLGRTDIVLKQTIESSIIGLLFISATVYFGIEWVALATTLAALFYLPRSLSMIFPLIKLDIKDFIFTLIMPIIATTMGILIFYTIRFLVALSLVEQLILAIIVGFLSLILAILFQYSTLKSLLLEIKKMENSMY